MASAIPPVVIEVDLNNTIGAIEIGSLFGVFLFGIVTLQTFNYYDNYKEDGWGNKILVCQLKRSFCVPSLTIFEVACIWYLGHPFTLFISNLFGPRFLEIGHTLGINFELYRATIILYGQPWELVRFPGIAAVTVVGGAITLITQVRPFHYHFTPPCGLTISQVFFSLRLTKLLPRPYHHIGSIAIIISSLRFITSIYLTVEGVILPNITVYREKCQWIVSAMFISSALVDIIIAVSMLYYLTRQRKQVKRYEHPFDNLIVIFTPRNRRQNLETAGPPRHIYHS